MNKIKIIARKQDHSFHRSWENNTVLIENDKELIGVNNKTLVVNKDLTTFMTETRALFYFSKDNWFNIIHIDDQINPYYYCNLSSPYEKKENILTYIDYDIDIKVDQYYNYEILDLEEYKGNKKRFNYSPQLDKKIKDSMQHLIELIKNKELIFEKEVLNSYYKMYDEK